MNQTNSRMSFKFIARHLAMATDRCDVGQMKGINVLPGEVLLGIFDLYTIVDPSCRVKREIEKWQTLVHMCRIWRSLVLGSPRRLNLQLWCSSKTPAADTLEVWPSLPLILECYSMGLARGLYFGTDNVVAALGQSDHVCEIILSELVDWQLEDVLPCMQVPFPELTRLELSWVQMEDETPPVIPDSFLGGSAPRLRNFDLDGIPFPGLPRLLLSAAHLVRLNLSNIPYSEHISPEAMAASLSVLTSLETFHIKFEFPQARPLSGSRSLHPPKRSILPALGEFVFTGVTEYLEDFVARIDAPQLNYMWIHFVNDVDFDCPRLTQFINRTQIISELNNASVGFSESIAKVSLFGESDEYSDPIPIVISCIEPDWPLLSVEQVYNSFVHLSTVEYLYISHQRDLVWEDGATEDTLWLQLLRRFTAVKNFYLSKEIAPVVAAVLQDSELIGDGISEVLPHLQKIFVNVLISGPLREKIEQFVAARQLSDRPITIDFWPVW